MELMLVPTTDLEQDEWMVHQFSEVIPIGWSQQFELGHGEENSRNRQEVLLGFEEFALVLLCVAAHLCGVGEGVVVVSSFYSWNLAVDLPYILENIWD